MEVLPPILDIVGDKYRRMMYGACKGETEMC